MLKAHKERCWKFTKKDAESYCSGINHQKFYSILSSFLPSTVPSPMAPQPSRCQILPDQLDPPPCCSKMYLLLRHTRLWSSPFKLNLIGAMYLLITGLDHLWFVWCYSLWCWMLVVPCPCPTPCRRPRRCTWHSRRPWWAPARLNACVNTWRTAWTSPATCTLSPKSRYKEKNFKKNKNRL